MGKKWKDFVKNNPEWPILFVLLVPIYCLGWYLSLNFGNPKIARYTTWSPRENKIAFECIYLTSSDYKDGLINDGIHLYPMRDICIKDVTNGDIIRVTEERGKYFPAWSSDGESLAWISTIQPGYQDEIVVWHISKNNYQNYQLPKPLRHAYDFEDKLEWIDNDNKLAVQGTGALLDLESGEFTYLPRIIEDLPVRYYLVSPDGRYTAVVLDLGDEGGNLQFIISIDNEIRLIAVDNSPHYEPPSWSENSKYIMWVAADDDKFQHETIFVTNIHSGDTLDLGLQSDIDIDYPVWSKDSNQILYMSFFDELHILDINISEDPFDVYITQHDIIDIARRDIMYPFSVSKGGDYVAFPSDDNQKLIVERIID